MEKNKVVTLSSLTCGVSPATTDQKRENVQGTEWSIAHAQNSGLREDNRWAELREIAHMLNVK